MIIMFVIITNDCGDCDYLDDYDCRDDRDTKLSEDILFVLSLVFDNSITYLPGHSSDHF